MPHRLMVMGHNHRWIVARPGEVFPWRGEGPFTFDPAERYLVVVHAVCDGWCALLDTAANVLTPVFLDGPRRADRAAPGRGSLSTRRSPRPHRRGSWTGPTRQSG